MKELKLLRPVRNIVDFNNNIGSDESFSELVRFFENNGFKQYEGCGLISSSSMHRGVLFVNLEFKYISSVFSYSDEIGIDIIFDEMVICTVEELFDVLKYCYNPSIEDYFKVL